MPIPASAKPPATCTFFPKDDSRIATTPHKSTKTTTTEYIAPLGNLHNLRVRTSNPYPAIFKAAVGSGMISLTGFLSLLIANFSLKAEKNKYLDEKVMFGVGGACAVGATASIMAAVLAHILEQKKHAQAQGMSDEEMGDIIITQPAI